MVLLQQNVIGSGLNSTKGLRQAEIFGLLEEQQRVNVAAVVWRRERAVEHKRIKGARTYTEMVFNFLNVCALEKNFEKLFSPLRHMLTLKIFCNNCKYLQRVRFLTFCNTNIFPLSHYFFSIVTKLFSKFTSKK